MNTIFQLLPELEPSELAYVHNLTKTYDDQNLMNFAQLYRVRRKDPQLILLTTLAGFLGFAGIHRLLLDEIGMGILYLLTAGLCFIGTIVDLINYKQLTYKYNVRIAHEVAGVITNYK
jgi:TM2 domain-containing membrane protein YozV